MKEKAKGTGIFKTVFFFVSFRPSLFFAVLSFSFMSGLLEGIGLSLFLPLLMNSDNKLQVGQVIGGMLEFLRSIGLDTNVNAILFLMIAFFLLRNITRYFEFYFRGRYEKGFIHSVQIKVLDGIFTMRFSEYLKRFYPSGTSLLTTDIMTIGHFIANFFVFLTSIATAAALAMAALLVNPWATIFGVLFGALLLPVQRHAGKVAKSLSTELTKATRVFTNRCQEIFELYRYLRSTGQFSLVKHKALEAAEQQRIVGINISTLSGLMQSLNQFLSILFLCGIIFFAVEVLKQPVARVVISIGLIYRIISMITGGLTAYQAFLSQMGAFDSVQNNLHLIESSSEKQGSHVLGGLTSEISFENVEFSSDESKLIKNVSFRIKKGEFLGILGKTGAGKSLLTQILTGLITPTSGNVKVDGIPVNELNLIDWRSRIGYVPQDFGVISGTFQEAICGKDSVLSGTELELFERVIRQAKLADVVMLLPEGIKTVVGKGGHPLSGGQRQRVALARELYRKPDILILDEATNSLDGATQESIARVIDSVRGHVTIIMIAHRLRMVASAEHIIIMDEGRLMMDGGPEVLDEYVKILDRSLNSEPRPAPRVWTGELENVFLELPLLTEGHLKVTDISISGLSFEGHEDWLLGKDSTEAYVGKLHLGENTIVPVTVRTVRIVTGRLGALFVDPAPDTVSAIQGFLSDSFILDFRKAG